MVSVEAEHIAYHCAVCVVGLLRVFVQGYVALAELRREVFCGQQNIDPFVDGVARDEVRNVAGARL